VPGEDYSDGVVTDAVHYPASTSLLREKPQRPPRAAIGWRPADHRHDGCLLAAVELRFGLGTWVFAQRVLQSAMHVPLSNSRDLARVSTDRDCRRTNRLACVEQQEHLDPSPNSRRQRRPAAALSLQLEPVFVRQS
jgi:hypothetical protein